MTGGTAAHAAIQNNLHMAVGVRLSGWPCRFYGSDLKVETVKGFRYPDGFVVCGSVAPRATTVREPVVIFEVLSDSTARTDLVTKNQDTPRLKRCGAALCWRRNRWQARCSSA